MSDPTATIPAPDPTASPLYRAVHWADVLVDVLATAGSIGLHPWAVRVDRYTNPSVPTVKVQLSTPDEVRALAAVYDLGRDDPTGSLFGHRGRILIDGHEVAVDVYCPRPPKAGA